MHLYVHVPFCARRCAYCDFSIAVRREVPVAQYLDALALEVAQATPQQVSTIYFGGGTPSRLGADGVRRMLDVIRGRYTPGPDAEITLEANPEDVTSEAAREWMNSGVNRLSLGVQSFDDGVLRWMHRTHDSMQARRAYDTSRDAGFDNISIDLIFALPEQLRRDWGHDLETAAALEPGHVSLYGLTVEPATPLARWRDRGAVSEAPEENFEREYLQAHDTLTAAGFEHYEVSNYGRPGRASRHNAAYWSLTPYVGHGPSAHSFDGTRRYWNESAYARWEQLLGAGATPIAGSEELTPEQREVERVYLALRTSAGYQADAIHAAEIERWKQAGWARTTRNHVVLTPTGWLRLDSLSNALTGHGSPCNV